MSSRSKRSPEEKARREKIRELLQLSNVGSRDDIQNLFKETSPGNLEHPLWGIRYCYFTGLELTQEPKENCVSYQFKFTQAKTNGEVPF